MVTQRMRTKRCTRAGGNVGIEVNVQRARRVNSVVLLPTRDRPRDMPLKFRELDYDWRLREGFPPMGSVEGESPDFAAAIRSSVPSLSTASTHELTSWIVSRLSFLTAGALELEGNDFSHDTNEIGYKLKATHSTSNASAHGAIVLNPERVYFAFVDAGIGDYQSLVVDLLCRYPEDLDQCTIRVFEPESKRSRAYGWDGYSLRR